MMAWMNPQMWAARPAPVGWAGSWPPMAPSGYPGPPPAPPGVDSRRWTAGQWRFNPMFQSSAAIPPQAWAPHPSWGAAAANWNPYKRIPNRGDATYWATKLSDNPLGLSDMIPADELRKQEQEKLQKTQQEQQDAAAPQTPWVWAPKDLEEPDEHDGNGSSTVNESADRDSRSAQNHHLRHSRHHPTRTQSLSSVSASRTQTQSQSQSVAQASSTQQVWSNGKTSHRSAYSHYNNKEGQAQRNSSTQQIPLTSAPAAVPTSSHHKDPYRRHATEPTESRSTPDANVSSASTQARSQTADAATSTSRSRDWQPTFSPNIVRTPDYYTAVSSTSAAVAATTTTDPPPQSSRRSTRDDSTLGTDRRNGKDERPKDRHSSRDNDSPPPAPHSHGPIYGPPTPTRADSGTSPGASTNTSTNARQSSMSSLSNSVSSLSIATPTTSAPPQGLLLPLSEEPADLLSADLLSPLLVAGAPPITPEKRSPRELDRSQTYPSLSASSQSGAFSTIPEESPSSSRVSRTPSSRTPQRSPSQYTTYPRTPKSVTRSRTYPTIEVTDPVIPPRPSPSASYTPPRSANSVNSLPPPPKDIVSSALSAASITSQSYLNNSRTSSQPYHSDSPPRGHSYPSSASHQSQSSSSASVTASTQSQSRPRRVRRGYWNRRGDHLVVIEAPESHSLSASPSQDRLYIVYAPHDLANPEELSVYPAPTVGWLNHKGHLIKYDPNVPELPESLPCRGEPPLRPYQSFVQYITI